MKKLLLVGLLLISVSATAKTWRETFDESTTTSQCEDVFDRMESKCDLAGIYRGGQNMDAVRFCKHDANKLKKDCVERVEDEIATKKEEEEEAKDRELMFSTIRNKQPDITLGCTKTGGSNDVNFPLSIEIAVWNGSVCKYNGSTHYCTIRDTKFSGTAGINEWELSRISGELRLTKKDVRDNWQSANYNCQKASAVQKKF